jgi:hypothetical protein
LVRHRQEDRSRIYAPLFEMQGRKMTPGYKERRAAKHAQAAAKVPQEFFPVMGTIDLTPNYSRHAFVGLRTRPQGNTGRKSFSGHGPEHAQANLDNANYDILRPLELVDALKPYVPTSIGGIHEDLGISTDDAGSIQNEIS